MATQIAYPLLTVEEFLSIDFSRGRKAELDDGVIRMMDGVTAWHACVQGNILAFIRSGTRGTGWMPYSTIFPTCTSSHSVRRPDIAVYFGRKGPEYDDDRVGDDPRVIFELLSDGTARTDLRTKLDEYRAMPSIDTIVFVDIAVERLRVVQRTGPNGWSDDSFVEPSDLALPTLNLVIPHAEIFVRD